MKCLKCKEKLIKDKFFCPSCGTDNTPVKKMDISQRGPHKLDVNKILESAGLTSSAEKSAFLSELASGVKPRDQVIQEGNVGRVLG